MKSRRIRPNLKLRQPFRAFYILLSRLLPFCAKGDIIATYLMLLRNKHKRFRGSQKHGSVCYKLQAFGRRL